MWCWGNCSCPLCPGYPPCGPSSPPSDCPARTEYITDPSPPELRRGIFFSGVGKLRRPRGYLTASGKEVRIETPPWGGVFTQTSGSAACLKGNARKTDLDSFGKVGLSFVRGVISQVHALRNDGFHFIPPSADGGTPCRRATSTLESGEQAR